MARPDNNTPQPTGAQTELRHQAQPNIFVKIQEILFLFLRNWPWFVLSLLITVGAATLYLKKTPKIYTRQVSLLIKADDKKGGVDESLKELGISSNVNISNELLSMRSSEVAQEIVKRLGLDVAYSRPGTFHQEVAYGVSLPIEVKFLELPNNEYVSMNLSLASDSSVLISDLTFSGEQYPNPLKLRLGQTVHTPVGNMYVGPSPYYRPGVADDLKVEHLPFESVAGSVKGRLFPHLRDKNSTIIDVNFRDESPARADDILNTFVVVYNEAWVKDRNRVTVSTSDFIKERLAVIEQELGSVDSDISNYKSSTLTLDFDAAGAVATSQATNAEQQIEDLNNQLYLTKYVRGYLTDGVHENQLLPAPAGLTSSSIQSQIANYNSVLLQRNNHLANSSPQNPLVMDLEENLATLRTTIIQSLDNEIHMLNTMMRSVQSTQGRAISKIASNPSQSKYLLSVERQQKVKESLYLFLLQKREENELNQAFTAYNTRLIEPAHAGGGPVEPVANSVLMMALIIGLAIPAGVLIMRENLNTAIRGRKDLDTLQVPFVGEIPQIKGTKPVLHNESNRKRRKHEKKEPRQIIVEDKSRNIMNEAFRVVRTNLEFVLGFDSMHKVIMVTSMNPASGKTFITANLANALAIVGKRVLTVDLDLRRGSLSEYVQKPKYGLSNYLSGQVADYHDMIKQVHQIDMLPAGTLPPNPAELFLSPRFKQFVEEVKQEYDYVFLDCPPVEIVADATIIARFADATLFVVRAHLMDRAFLPDIQSWYEMKRYPSMMILLNGTIDAFSHYGYHKYGYRYGYHYGHYGHYGYGDK